MMDIDTQNSQMTVGTKNGVNSGPLRVKTTLELAVVWVVPVIPNNINIVDMLKIPLVCIAKHT